MHDNTQKGVRFVLKENSYYMKRRRTKKPKGTKYKPIEALYLIKEKVNYHLSNIKAARMETKDNSLLLKEREWANIDAVINNVMRETEPLKELNGWELGDSFTFDGNKYTIEGFPSLDKVRGRIANKKTYMGSVSSVTMDINNLQ